MILRGFSFLFCLTLCLAFLFDCSSAGEIKITKDEFKNAHIVQLEQEDLEASEDDGTILPSSLYFGNITYSKELSEQKVDPVVVVRFMITAKQKNFDLEPEGFLKIDDKKFDIKFDGVASKLNSKAYRGTTTDPATGKEVAYSGVSINKQLQGSFRLAKEQENLILESKILLLRSYSGSNPITFSIKEERLEKLKEFLKTNTPEETPQPSNVVPDKKTRKRAR